MQGALPAAAYSIRLSAGPLCAHCCGGCGRQTFLIGSRGTTHALYALRCATQSFSHRALWILALEGLEPCSCRAELAPVAGRDKHLCCAPKSIPSARAHDGDIDDDVKFVMILVLISIQNRRGVQHVLASSDGGWAWSLVLCFATPAVMGVLGRRGGHAVPGLTAHRGPRPNMRSAAAAITEPRAMGPSNLHHLLIVCLDTNTTL